MGRVLLGTALVSRDLRKHVEQVARVVRSWPTYMHREQCSCRRCRETSEPVTFYRRPHQHPAVTALEERLAASPPREADLERRALAAEEEARALRARVRELRETVSELLRCNGGAQ